MTTARSRRPAKTDYHVVSADHARSWRVLRGGDVRGDRAPAVLAHAPTRAQAVYRASLLARADAPSRLVVHGPHGCVEALRDYA